jgi:hypothetical protein
MAASEVAVINNHEIIRDEYIMVPIDYLLYAPVNLMKGMSMNAVEYASKVKELEDAQKAIETAVAPLIDAGRRLEGNGWQDLPVEGHKPRPIQTGDRAGQPRRMNLKEWPKLTAINELAAVYWAAIPPGGRSLGCTAG